MLGCSRNGFVVVGAILLASGLRSISAAADSAELATAIKTVQSVGPKGAENVAAGRAWRQLAQAAPTELTTILAGFDGANPLAANYLSAAVETIAERTLRAKQKLPTAALEAFLAQTEHNPAGRRLAYEWLVKADSTATERLLPMMLDDPSMELRRDAVAQKMAAAEARLPKDKAAAGALFRTAFTAARDLDQVKALAEKLRGLGQKVDLPVHYGFIMEWKLIGPFDNTDKKGYAVEFPPEKEIDLMKSFEGKVGPVRWVDYTTADEFGVVDLNVALTKYMGATAYAYAEIDVPAERAAEVRVGSITATKAWCNGQLLFAAEAYHMAMEVDQYSGKARLHPGKNQILVKICQNEQTDSWAQDWKFQCRVCDKLGTAILSTDRPPTPKESTAPPAKPLQ
ncbi:MAG TPA: hypothetical protein VFE24_05410 [Pirellulales bacterium]|jgi:hypothetical protein|nr:hypothetical protein [Pirellulales bacterium]